jgi:hypothetical protein
MRRLILLLSLAVAANGSLYSPAQAQGAGNPPPPPPPSAARPAANQANSPENCGTPDRFLPCPPMPRHPLPYFPENRNR